MLQPNCVCVCSLGRLIFESIDSISLMPAAMVQNAAVEQEDDAHNSRSECTYYIDLYSSSALGRIVSTEIRVKSPEDLLDVSTDVVFAPVAFSPMELFTESIDFDTLFVEVKRLTSVHSDRPSASAEEKIRRKSTTTEVAVIGHASIKISGIREAASEPAKLDLHKTSSAMSEVVGAVRIAVRRKPMGSSESGDSDSEDESETHDIASSGAEPQSTAPKKLFGTTSVAASAKGKVMSASEKIKSGLNNNFLKSKMKNPLSLFKAKSDDGHRDRGPSAVAAPASVASSAKPARQSAPSDYEEEQQHAAAEADLSHPFANLLAVDDSASRPVSVARPAPDPSSAVPAQSGAAHRTNSSEGLLLGQGPAVFSEGKALSDDPFGLFSNNSGKPPTDASSGSKKPAAVSGSSESVPLAAPLHFDDEIAPRRSSAAEVSLLDLLSSPAEDAAAAESKQALFGEDGSVVVTPTRRSSVSPNPPAVTPSRRSSSLLKPVRRESIAASRSSNALSSENAAEESGSAAGADERPLTRLNGSSPAPSPASLTAGDASSVSVAILDEKVSIEAQAVPLSSDAVEVTIQAAPYTAASGVRAEAIALLSSGDYSAESTIEGVMTSDSVDSGEQAIAVAVEEEITAFSEELQVMGRSSQAVHRF